MNKPITFLLLILGVAFSCSTPDKQPYQLPNHAKSVLTGDSTKTWKLASRFNNNTRMNMGDCFLSHRETYNSDMTMHNNSGEHKDCGETLVASWKFVKDKKGNYYIKMKSDQIPALMKTEENYKLFRVLRLSENQMTLQFNHKQFSSKTTTITDIYVPQGVEIKNREFHW